MKLKVGTYQSSLGLVTIGTLLDDLHSVELGPLSLLYARYGKWLHVEEDAPPSKVVDNALQCIEKHIPYPNRLLTAGTTFQHQVWKALRDIPLGQIVSYKAVAEEIGRPTAYRAVASAVAANPIAVIVPCHRVVGGKNPYAYRWGEDIKRKLLDKEYLATHPMVIGY